MVSVHRDLIRNLQDWKALFESREVDDVLVSSDGSSYSLWDVQNFYGYRTIVSTRMRQSIEYCLFENMKEKDAAERMGISPNSPVSIYATIGLTTMLARAVEGELPGYQIEIPVMEAAS